MNPAHNLYFHIPFCISKCRYCAFSSLPLKNPDWDGFTNQIISEIDDMANRLGKISAPTVFFGGGTPSLMPAKSFDKIINHINKTFILDKNCEITIESNPLTLDFEKLSDFKSIGLNRLSIGVQSLDDSELEFMGRTHTAQDAINLIKISQDIGLRTSADFIYGLPHHNVDTIEKLCRDINKLNLNHCSLYELTVEENTPFGKMNLTLPDNDTMADMFNTIENKLNLPRYEVSNYGRDECRHNKNIWAGEAYIGFGKYAAGRVLINNTWYEQMGGGELFKPITDSDRNIEKLILGLRTKYGVSINSGMHDIIDLDFVKNNSDLIIQEDDKLIATKKGLIILDDILLNLIK